MNARIVGAVLGSVALAGGLLPAGASARGPSTPGVVVTAWNRDASSPGWRLLLSAWADAEGRPSAAVRVRVDGIAVDGLTAHRVAAGDTVCAGDGHEKEVGPDGYGAVVRGVGPLAAGGGLLPDGSKAQIWIDLRDAGPQPYGDRARVRVRPAPHSGGDDEGDACGSDRVWTYDSGWRPVEQVTTRLEGQPAPQPAPPADVTAFATPFCAVPPPPRPPRATPDRLTLTPQQLLINQRIGQAAIRRLRAVEARLDAGLRARDLCGYSIAADRLAPGSTTELAVASLAAVAPADPAPIADPGRRGRGTPVRMATSQLRTNQRIYQAALRRADAIEHRLDAGLTGGDIADGQITQGKLSDRLRVVAAALGPAPAASVTAVAARAGGNPSRMSFTVHQLEINQRIARAAVRRANALVRRMESGISGTDLAPGSLTAADLG